MKQVLTGVVLMVLAATLAGAGTFAHFSDTETSTGNISVAGTLDLKVSDRDEGFGDGVTATWTLLNMRPGDSIPPAGTWSVNLQNWGNMPADHVEIACSNTVIDPPGPESDTEEGTIDMDWAMEITSMTYNGIDLLALLSDNNGNGIKDLDDFEAQGFDDLQAPPPNGAGTLTFSMSLRFHPTLADNDYQGDTLVVTITFTLNQHSSQ